MPKSSRKTKTTDLVAIAAFPAVEWFSVDQLEAISGISVWTWRRWAQNGKIASAKVSTRLLISRAEFERVMQDALRPRKIESAAERIGAGAKKTVDAAEDGGR
jgi:hypothetical protein